jgi:hypothetical protein
MGMGAKLAELQAQLDQAVAALPEGAAVPAELRQLLDMLATVKQEREAKRPKWRSQSAKRNRHGRGKPKP